MRFLARAPRAASWAAAISLAAAAALVAAPAASQVPCPLIGDGDWSVTLETNAVSGHPEIVIDGRVTAPSAGWGVNGALGPQTRSAPPNLTILLAALPPDGGAAAVLTELDVSLRFPAAHRAYRSIRLVCGGRLLAEVRNLTIDEPRPGAGGCGWLGAGRWRASVRRTANGMRELVVSGVVQAPTPGYTISGRLGPTTRSLPPSQIIALTATPPEGVVGQVVTEQRVEMRFLTPHDAFRAVTLTCGAAPVARLNDVR